MAYAGPVWHYGESKTTNMIWCQQPTKKKKKKKRNKAYRFLLFYREFQLTNFSRKKKKENKTTTERYISHLCEFAMDSRRFIFFGGQGSRLLSSSSPSVCLSNNENASNVNLFMSACHAAFLQEALRSRSHGPVPLWAQFSLPAHPEALLKIPTEYCDNPIFQGVCLCVNQLRTYLVSNPDIAIDTQSVTGGFCSGMIPAVVLSSSTTLDDFIRHSTEAVRLAYWIGFRAGELSEQIGGEEWQRHPWAVSVFKPDKEQLEQAIASFNTRVSGKSGVCMASRLGQASFSVVGPGHLLKQFQEQCHSLGWHSERVFVHALYHGNVLGMSAMEKVLQDVKREGIVFPSTNDLKKPLLSCRDGHLLKPSPTRLLDYILQIILVDPIDLCAIWSGLTEVVQSSSSDWIIMTIGPGANGLLSIVSRDFPQLTKELLVDLPGLEKDQSQSGFAIVGMSVNLPGGSSKEEFWSTLENGLNTVDEVSLASIITPQTKTRMVFINQSNRFPAVGSRQNRIKAVRIV